MLCLQELAQEGERKVRTGTRPGVGRVHRACPVCGTSGVQEGIRFFRKPRSCFRICCPTKQRTHPLPPSEGESLKGPVCPLGRSRGQSRGQRGRALEPLHGCPSVCDGEGAGHRLAGLPALARRVELGGGCEWWVHCVAPSTACAEPTPGPGAGYRKAGSTHCESWKQQGVTAQPQGGGAREPGPGRSPAEGTPELCVREAGICQEPRAGVGQFHPGMGAGWGVPQRS